MVIYVLGALVVGFLAGLMVGSKNAKKVQSAESVVDSARKQL